MDSSAHVHRSKGPILIDYDCVGVFMRAILDPGRDRGRSGCE